MAFEKERHAEAVQLLTKASDQLSGDEAARSSLYAGDAWRAQGRITDARLMYERAQSQVKNDSTLKVLISDRLAAVSGQQRDGSGTFTVQIGAFSTFIRAQMQADRYRARAQSAGLSTPRIVQTINTQGAKVYAVRVGRFTTRGAADAARQALGSEARIMTVSKE
jgi:cell division protein FtsN